MTAAVTPIRRAGIALVTFYAAWLALVISNHELGHLEAQAWNIARSAQTLDQLLTLVRVEGHSPVGFILAWPLTMLGTPVPGQLAGGFIGILVAVLLVRDRPFPILVTAIVLFGHYLSYEYTVVPRTYLLAVLGIALTAHRLHVNDQAIATPIILCCLVAASGALGLCLSFSMLLVVLVLRRRAHPDSVGTGPLQRARALSKAYLHPEVLPWLGLYLATCILITLAIVAPGTKTAFGQDLSTGVNLTGATLSNALLAAPFPHVEHMPLFKNLTEHGSGGRWLLVGAAMVVYAAVFIQFSRWPIVAFSWILALVLVIGVATFTGFTAERLLGHLVLFALFLFWIRPLLILRSFRSRAAPGDAVGSKSIALVLRAANWTLVMTLLYHAVVGVALGIVDTQRMATPFKHAAESIEAAIDVPFDLIVSDAVFTSPLMTYLDQDAFDLGCLCRTRHARWEDIDRRAESLNPGLAWCSHQSSLTADERHEGPVVAVIEIDAIEELGSFTHLERLPGGFAYSREPSYDIFLWLNPVCAS